MGLTVGWDNSEKTVLMYSFKDPWTWEEYYEMAGKGRAMLASVDHKVMFVIDLSQSKIMPPGAFTHLRRGVTFTHPNQGLVILVGLKSFLQAIANVMSRTYPKVAQKVRFVATLDDAYRIMAEQRVR